MISPVRALRPIAGPRHLSSRPFTTLGLLLTALAAYISLLISNLAIAHYRPIGKSSAETQIEWRQLCVLAT